MRDPGRRTPAPGALLVCLAATVAGCGGDDLESRYAVSGKVTRQGQPGHKGTINFLPANPAGGRVASGEIQPDGSYTLTTKDPGDGAMKGDYLVTISMIDVDNSKQERMPGGMPRLDQMNRVKVKALVPPKYSDPSKTELKAKVEPSRNNLDFDLKD